MTPVVSRRGISKALLLVAAMTATSNIAPAEENPFKNLFDVEWRVIDLAGKDPIVDYVPTLMLHETGRAGGNTGCNTYFSTVEIDGNTIRFSEIGSTYIACGEAVMDQEHAFLEALELTERFQLSMDGLELLDRDGALLVKLAATL